MYVGLHCNLMLKSNFWTCIFLVNGSSTDSGYGSQRDMYDDMSKGQPHSMGFGTDDDIQQYLSHADARHHYFGSIVDKPLSRVNTHPFAASPLSAVHTSPILSNAGSPSFVGSMGSVPMTTSYSMSPPSTGLPEPPLPLTPYSHLTPLFPNNNHVDSAHSNSAYANNNQSPLALYSQPTQTSDYSSFINNGHPSPPLHSAYGYVGMSAPAELGHFGHVSQSMHHSQSLFGGLGLKVEEDEEARRQALSLSPTDFGIRAPLRNASGTIVQPEDEQFTMDIDDDGMPINSQATIRQSHRTHPSHILTNPTNAFDLFSYGDANLYSQGHLYPQSAPASGGFDDSRFTPVFVEDSPSMTSVPLDYQATIRRPRRSTSSMDVLDQDYKGAARRPRLRNSASGPVPPRPRNPSTSIPVGPGEMIITATLPIRPGVRGRAATFGGRAPRSVVPTPVPNLTKKSRGRRVPVAKPLDLELDFAGSVSSSTSSSGGARRSSRASASVASAALARSGDDDDFADDAADDDDEDEYGSKSKSKLSPRMQAMVEEAIARGCSTTATGKARIFTCPAPDCLKCFARGEHLKRHVRSIHTEEKRKCHSCLARFSF